MSLTPSYSSTSPELSQEQKNDIAASTAFKTGTIIPAYQGLIGGAKELYELNAPGVLNAAQNVGGVANQAQKTFGETGESALRTGITGLENLFSPDYEANQIAAAMGPAQAQYLQNVQNQQAQFGGTGNLGSAREALASRQLAGTNQMNQAMLAAQVQKDIAGQRAGVGSTLAQLGQSGLTSAQQAAGTQLTAAGVPMDKFAQLASIYYGAPAQSYTGNFTGAQGKTETGIKASLNPFAGL
jgi:hypothetical protein